MRTITIARRYRGPVHSANGGYAAGLLAEEVGAAAMVTLRQPPPLDVALAVDRDGDRVLLRHEGALVAEAEAGDPDLRVAPSTVVAFDVVAARGPDRPAGWGTENFGECFSCGVRVGGDGLGIHPRRFDDFVAAPWVAREVSVPVVWAAIDCSGAFAVGEPGRGEPLLARITAHVERLPLEGERCVVVGWPLGADGRKLHAGTALLGEDGAVCAVSRQLWIVPRDSG